MTSYQAELNRIQLTIAQDIKPLGFRKRGRTFNRPVGETGIVQVINFQAGGSLSHLHGQFTINLGIFVPEVWAALADRTAPNFIQEYFCEMRERLGSLGSKKDIWWGLEADADESLSQVRKRMADVGMRYLDQRSTRAAILKEFRRQRDSRTGHIQVRAALAIASMYCAQADQVAAQKVLNSECRHLGRYPVAGFIQTVCERLNLQVPFS
jgi:hypothetical protein